MPNPYFSNLGDFLYVNRTREGRSEGDYSLVKNLFKRAKLREDIYLDLSFTLCRFINSSLINDLSYTFEFLDQNLPKLSSYGS